MKYTVVWKPAAEGQLAALWTTGPDRPEVAAAADLIDVLLAQGPMTVGESREQEMRILIVPPLAVNYRVVELDYLVMVSDAWRWGLPP